MTDRSLNTSEIAARVQCNSTHRANGRNEWRNRLPVAVAILRSYHLLLIAHMCEGMGLPADEREKERFLNTWSK